MNILNHIKLQILHESIKECDAKLSSDLADQSPLPCGSEFVSFLLSLVPAPPACTLHVYTINKWCLQLLPATNLLYKKSELMLMRRETASA